MKDATNRDVRARKAWRTFLVIALTAAVVAPVAAFASNRFNDVPSDHTFHDDITWLTDNDVTKGCNPPDNTKYCPDDNVTRGQMAAFMKRLATNRVVDADTVDGKQASSFLGKNQTASNADMLDGKDASDFLGVDETAADADRLAGATAWNYVDGRFVSHHNPVEMPWGEPIRVLAMETPAGHYEFAWEITWGSQSAPDDFADGHLECYVSTAGDLHISGSGNQAGTVERVTADEVRLLGGFPVMQASSGPLHPVRHDQGWFAVECINTFEDDAGSPIDVTFELGTFSTNKLEQQPWIHPRPAE